MKISRSSYLHAIALLHEAASKAAADIPWDDYPGKDALEIAEAGNRDAVTYQLLCANVEEFAATYYQAGMTA